MNKLLRCGFGVVMAGAAVCGLTRAEGAGAATFSDDFSISRSTGAAVNGRTSVTGEVWFASAASNGAVINESRGVATHPGGFGGGYAYIDLPSAPSRLEATFELGSAQASLVLAAGAIGSSAYLHPQVSLSRVNWLATVPGAGVLVNIFESQGYWSWPALELNKPYSFEYWLNYGGDPTAMRVKDPTGAERTLYSDYLPALLAGARGLTMQPTDTDTVVRTIAAEYEGLTPVPEPSSYALLALGLVALGALSHRAVFRQA